MRNQLNVRFGEKQLNRIQTVAAGMGLTTSEFVRVAAAEYLNGCERSIERCSESLEKLAASTDESRKALAEFGEVAKDVLSHDEYTKKDEWGGYTVRKATTGFVVECWSARQGELTGHKFLRPYLPGMDKDADLSADYNGLWTNGGYLAECPIDKVRVLRKGHIVK